MADYSFIAGNGLQQVPYDPLKMVTNLQSLQNMQTENQLNQQSLLNKQQELQNQKLANQTGQSSLAMAQMQRHGQILFGLSNLKDDQLQGGTPLYTSLDQERDAGVIDPVRYGVLKSQIDQITQNGGDKDGSLYRPLLNRGLVTSGAMSGPEQVHFLMGTPQETTLPGGMKQVVVPPGQGSPPGTPTQNLGTPYGGGMSPEAGADFVYVEAPDGTKQGPYPKASIGELIRQGYKVAPSGGATTAPAPTATTAPTSPTTSNLAAPAANIQFGGKLPNQGQIDLANASRTKDSADMAALTSRNWNDMQGSLQTILNLSPGVSSGKGTDFANTAKQILVNTLPSVAASLNIDPNKSMDQQDMYKALARAAMAQGNRSDAQLFESIAANPNSQMSPDAMQRAAGYVLALNNQERVLTMEAHSRATHSAMDLNTQNPAVRAQIQQETDANGYRAPYMSDREYADYKKTLSSSGKQKLQHTLELIHKYNLPAAGMTPTVQTGSP